ncbi:conserved hypothetical protein [Thioalkalivibrio sulfidiphilus HL-EbGr7]|uniref:Uncharacterized protein n=1 Tax=Thioalkalivibrio sulfidiphilus (strain HL-EbGR7) TaxID=396588 RepID=B8GUX0_THISH|nr:hypothetical protein [Thioalkalivibrio sulfidiphilus]ACL71481.1 conserved hypothetical protein [Thioalkalivibrio sulfidiphilus HL-EbGr7]
MAVELPESGIWDVVVSVDGADVSDRLTGRLRIEAEEGAARIAEFTLLPTGGQLALTDWVGAPAVIDVIQDGSAHRLFTGLVDHPRYDPATRQVTLICTDARQEKLDALDAASIEALTPGALWSPDVFDGDADGLRRAEDRLSTLPAVLDLGLDGATWLLTPWAAKPVPDHVFESVLDESLSIEVAERRSLVNEVAVELDYRFTRQRHRERDFHWAWAWPPGGPGGFCSWFFDTTELPDKDMIQRAAEGGGWSPYPQSFSWAELPPSSNPPVCGQFEVGWINPTRVTPTVLGASWTAARRMTQAVTEQYRLTVRAPQSIARHGVVTGRERSVAFTDFDSGDWEREADQGRPEGAVQDALGDWIVDHDDRDQCDLAIETLLAMARTRILAAHRRNFVAWQWPGVVPGLDRADTVRVSTDGVSATGKVAQLLTEIDFSTASLLTTVRIAVSRSGTADPVSETPLLAPGPPDTTPQASEEED